MGLMFFDSNPPPKGYIYGWFTCPTCKKKCDGIINDKYCIKCWKDIK